MAIDWDAELLAPAMQVFGEGQPADQSTWPLYTPRRQPAFRLAGAVFDAEYEQVEIQGDGNAVTTRRPVLGVRTSLFPRPPAQNDQVFIPATPLNQLPAPGRSYVVRDAQPDGHGHTKLMLMEMAA